jgi:hypothetical protein
LAQKYDPIGSFIFAKTFRKITAVSKKNPLSRYIFSFHEKFPGIPYRSENFGALKTSACALPPALAVAVSP